MQPCNKSVAPTHPRTISFLLSFPLLVLNVLGGTVLRSSEFEIDHQTLQGEDKSLGSKKSWEDDGLFLKGPIPLTWLIQAGLLPGKSLHIGIALWFLSGLQKSKQVSLTRSVLEMFGVRRHSAYRALKLLESSSLVEVKRQAGRSPVVTIKNCTETGPRVQQ